MGWPLQPSSLLLTTTAAVGGTVGVVVVGVVGAVGVGVVDGAVVGGCGGLLQT